MTTIPRPNKWQISQFGQLCNFQNGYAFKNTDYQQSEQNAYVVFKMGNIAKGGGLKQNPSNSYISRDKCHSLARFVLKKGDITISMTDMKASMALIGHTAIINEDDKYILNQRVGRITVKKPDILNSRFLFYYTNSTSYINYLRGLSHSGVQVNLSTTDITESPIMLPPLLTQRKIAAILSAYDDLIENNLRRIEILEEMAQNLYTEWFVKLRFPGREKVKMIDSPLGRIPEGWEIKKLGEIADVNSLSLKRGQEPEVINYIDISSVSTGQINKIEKMPFIGAPGRARRIVRHGDVIWSTVRPNRKSYGLIINPAANLIVSTGFAVITPKIVPYSYLYEIVTTDDFIAYLVNHTTGSAYPAVSSSDILNAPVLLPEAVVLGMFHENTSDMFGERENLFCRNINLRTTRDLLLPRLISGELDLSALDIKTGDDE